jgi:excisionase family DNA binding protein
MKEQRLLSIGYVAKQLGVSLKTIRRWEKESLIYGIRTPKGHRRFPESELERLRGKIPSSFKRCAIYARVSSSKQETSGNLERQKERLIEYAEKKGYEIVKIFSEQASGINENRKQLTKLIRMGIEGEIDIVLIEFKDRLARFGYSYLEVLLSSYGVSIEAIAQKPSKDVTSELVEDMLSIITCFAARLYGRRSQQFKQKIEKVIKEEETFGKSNQNNKIKN